MNDLKLKTLPEDIGHSHPIHVFRKFEIKYLTVESIKSDESININSGERLNWEVEIKRIPKTKYLLTYPKCNDHLGINNPFIESRFHSEVYDENFNNLEHSLRKMRINHNQRELTLKKKIRKIKNLINFLAEDHESRGNKTKFLLRLILMEIFFPNILAALVVILFFFINQNEYGHFCQIDSMYQLFYVCLISTLGIFYFFLFGYYMFNPFLFRKVPKNQIKIWKGILLFFVLICTFFLKIAKINGYYIFQEIDLDIHLFNLVLGLLYSFFIKCKFRIIFLEIKVLFKIFASFFVVITFHYYLVKNYIFVYFHSMFIEVIYGKYIFQILLLIYLKMYGKFIFFLMVKFFEIIPKNTKSSYNSALDSILIFLKFHISEAICCCVIIPIINQNDNFEFLFGIFNVVYQLSTLYSTQDHLTNFFLNFFYWVINKKRMKKKVTSITRRCKLIMAGSTNEVLALILTRIIIMFFMPQFIYPIKISMDTKLVTDCRFLINPKIKLMFENDLFLILLALLNLFYFIALINDKKIENEKKLVWKLESYGFITKVGYNVLVHLATDLHLQFYFNLYWLGSRME